MEINKLKSANTYLKLKSITFLVFQLYSLIPLFCFKIISSYVFIYIMFHLYFYCIFTKSVY